MSSPSPSKRLKTENNSSNNDNNQSSTSHQDTRTQATDDQPAAAAAHPDSNSQSESSTTRTSPRILQLQRQRQRQRELQNQLETQRQRERERQSEAGSSQTATRRNQTTSTSNRNQNHPESISDSPPSCSSTSNPSIIPSTPTSSRRNNSGRRVLHLNSNNNIGQGSTSNPDNPAADPPNGGGRVRTPLEEIPLWWADERGDEIRRNRQTMPTSDPGPSALEINSSSSSVTRGGHRSARLRRGHHGPNLQVPILSSSNNPSSSPSFSPHTPSRRANRNQVNEEATTLPESPSAGREGLSLTRSNRRNLPFMTPSRGREDSDSMDRDRGRRSLQNHQAEASTSRNRLTSSSSSTPSSSGSSLNDRNRRAENREIIRNTAAASPSTSSSNLTTTNNEGSLRRTTRSGNVFGNILPSRRNRSQTPSSSNAPNDENSHSLEDQPSTSTPSSRNSNRRSDRNREEQGEIEVGGSSFESSLDDTPELINQDSSIGDDSSSSGFIVPPSPMRRNIGRNQGRGIPSSSSTSTSDPSSNPPSSSTPRLRRSRNSTAIRTIAPTSNEREEGTSIAGSTRSRRNLQDSERGGQEEEGQIIDQSQALSSQPRNEAASDNNSLRSRPSNPQFRINDLPSSSSDSLDSESTALDRLAASSVPDRADSRKPNENEEAVRDRLSLEETR